MVTGADGKFIRRVSASETCPNMSQFHLKSCTIFCSPSHLHRHFPWCANIMVFKLVVLAALISASLVAANPSGGDQVGNVLVERAPAGHEDLCAKNPTHPTCRVPHDAAVDQSASVRGDACVVVPFFCHHKISKRSLIHVWWCHHFPDACVHKRAAWIAQEKLCSRCPHCEECKSPPESKTLEEAQLERDLHDCMTWPATCNQKRSPTVPPLCSKGGGGIHGCREESTEARDVEPAVHDDTCPILGGCKGEKHHGKREPNDGSCDPTLPPSKGGCSRHVDRAVQPDDERPPHDDVCNPNIPPSRGGCLRLVDRSESLCEPTGTACTLDDQPASVIGTLVEPHDGMQIKNCKSGALSLDVELDNIPEFADTIAFNLSPFWRGAGKTPIYTDIEWSKWTHLPINTAKRSFKGSLPLPALYSGKNMFSYTLTSSVGKLLPGPKIQNPPTQTGGALTLIARAC
ncbi:uncharacterized protein L969DRAFT_92028 [Mixia osmundae IAM 14324]|uniref:Uncharacterized protein n=1 Tax=Mixia osmundae (strain CBS 9802 / IAM 14324 / JCM 22182 / KY 12970) TaxID=764103 RepID=G7DZD2_MIXOS|nr:uncharacterized protein L969DRAFT_92028 [Mixia osmundae IAM 14324]KEI42593.1 hypothetical protein L969DRAFT_92028 [Mixia osmundae IAM 14324]GAA95942.1 hypothetical protein E5Q_02600 [Mixia osmundae IAM 14324]